MTLKKIAPILLLIFVLCGQSLAQNMKSYEGHWEAQLPNQQLFSPLIKIRTINAKMAELRLISAYDELKKQFIFADNQEFEIELDKGLSFRGTINSKKRSVSGFMKSGQWFYHLDFAINGFQQWTTTWPILLAKNFQSPLYLSIENANNENYEAYIFSAEARYPGFFCYNFSKNGKRLAFSDFRSGLNFEGELLEKQLTLRLKIGKLLLGQLTLNPSQKEWDLKPKTKAISYSNTTPKNLNDGLITQSIAQLGPKINERLLQQMVDSINTNKITNTHGVLIAKNNKLVYEAYFGGNDVNTPHDMRSASKSISSALIGIAIDQRILNDTAQKLIDLLPPSYQNMMNEPRKKAISIGNLLTMSSGLDAIDFGIDRKSLASEDIYQPTADWAGTIFKAPMINYPGTHANYGSANPYLLGFALASKLGNKTLGSIDQNLFKPLKISNYIVQQDEKGYPYFGGGLFMRSRDMLKFGLLYANRGQWKGQQLISKSWIEASFKNYLILENHPEKNGYGFLWWHYHYQVGNQTIRTIEARGAGGQYIFIVPALDMVVVVTSGNFRNGRVWQPEKIMENYILPAFLNSNQ